VHLVTYTKQQIEPNLTVNISAAKRSKNMHKD